MQLFFMRHGEAGFDASSDRERTLTDTGRYHSRLMANWLTQQFSQIDLVIVSPFLRAQQTWQVVSKHLQEPRHFVTLEDFTPNSDPLRATDAVLAYAEQYNANSVLVITHMPLVGYMVHECDKSVEPPIFATAAIAQLDKHGEQIIFKSMNTPNTIAA